MDVKQKNNLTRLALVACVVVFTIGDYGLGFEQWAIHWWADIAWTLASLLTGLKCLQTARRLPGRYKVAWNFFGAACVAWFLGMLVWALCLRKPFLNSTAAKPLEDDPEDSQPSSKPRYD